MITEHFPNGNFLPKFLVDDHDNAHDVGRRKSTRVKVRPQVQLQVLAKLQQHYPSYWKPDVTDSHISHKNFSW